MSDTVVTWPENEVKALKEFCEKHGITGFNCGNIPPATALAMLKEKIGMGDVPLEERVPYGYQRMKKSSILHG